MAYIGIDGVARKAIKIYIGVDGVPKSAVKAYIGDVNDKAQLWWGGSITPTPPPEEPTTGYPVFSPLWRGRIPESIYYSLTKIHIVDTYTPTGNESASWDVGWGSTVMAYLNNGTELTIAGNGSGKIIPYSAQGLFLGLRNLVEITGLNLFDMSNADSLFTIFGGCRSLKTLDLRGWDVSKVESLEEAFEDCSSLTTIYFDGWNTSKLLTTASMFIGCESLTVLDLSDFNTKSVTSFNSMFQDCVALEAIYVGPDWSTSQATDTNYMFRNCGVSDVTVVG